MGPTCRAKHIDQCYHAVLELFHQNIRSKMYHFGEFKSEFTFVFVGLAVEIPFSGIS